MILPLHSDWHLETIWPAKLLVLSTLAPHRVLIASIMEEVNRASWEEIVERCQEAGADAFEINFRCGGGWDGALCRIRNREGGDSSFDISA